MEENKKTQTNEKSEINKTNKKEISEPNELNLDLNLVTPLLNRVIVQSDTNLLPLLFNIKKDKHKQDFIKELARQDYEEQKMQGVLNKKINIQPINFKLKEPVPEKYSEKESENTSESVQTGLSLKRF